MNSYKFNSWSSYYLRCLIANFFSIPVEGVYRKVKDIECKNNELPKVYTSDGKVYEIILKEII